MKIACYFSNNINTTLGVVLTVSTSDTYPRSVQFSVSLLFFCLWYLLIVQVFGQRVLRIGYRWIVIY